VIHYLSSPYTSPYNQPLQQTRQPAFFVVPSAYPFQNATNPDVLSPGLIRSFQPETSISQALVQNPNPASTKDEGFAVKRVTPRTLFNQQADQTIKTVAKAAAFVLPAIIIGKKFPAVSTKQTLLPTQWQVLTKLGLGIMAASQLSKLIPSDRFSFLARKSKQGTQPSDLAEEKIKKVKPAAWANALLNLGVMTPLLSGKNGVKLLPFTAPLVVGMVMGNLTLTNILAPKLKENFDIPPKVTGFGMSILSSVAAFFAMPKILKPIIRTMNNKGTVALSAAATCARGCCASVVCISELAEMGSVIFSMISSNFSGSMSENPKSEF
ncbi:MAG: hypothetical protein AAGI66_09995, partial [Cyanobacteria bacterium P01_H01_bin.74]